MVAIRLSAVVGADGKLTVQVPESIPAGPVEVLIETKDTMVAGEHSAREAARAKLAAAGVLSTAHKLPAGARVPTPAELLAAGTLPSGAPSSEALIRLDRDEN
jgi:hypothetical protein